jgi:DNA-binding NtrC family response regulator
VDGISLLREWSESGRLDCPVVMISGHGTLETAVEATRLGAEDFIQKPISLAKLLATVKQALGGAARRPRPAPAADRHQDPQGNSPQMQLLRQKAEQAARHTHPVLLTGEPGAGKECIAAYIHRRAQAAGVFVVSDRDRLFREDARAYLLGEGDQPGLLDRAARGTLYLPNVDRLDPAIQQLLAGVLEAGQFTPLGDDRPQALACRVIAGLAGDGEALVQGGQLDEQLHLQLHVLSLHVPALRERPEDVPELVGFYADWYSNNEDLPYRQFSISALNRLRNHDWPGNERELRNIVQRLLIMGGEGEVTAQEVDEALRDPAGEAPEIGSARPAAFDLPLREAREQFEREYLIYQLRKAGGSVGKLSDQVGMERTHLYRKLRSLGIDPKSVVSGSAR